MKDSEYGGEICMYSNINGTCFNRYMVECEFIEDEIDRSRDLCFNRYVVECELAQGLVGCIGYAGF